MSLIKDMHPDELYLKVKDRLLNQRYCLAEILFQMFNLYGETSLSKEDLTHLCNSIQNGVCDSVYEHNDVKSTEDVLYQLFLDW